MGEGEEVNPYKNNEKTNTLFDKTHGNASEKFNRNYEHFHPNATEAADEGGDFFLDLAHKSALRARLVVEERRVGS